MIETRLQELAAHVDFPAEPDVAPAVMARLRAEPEAAAPRRRWRPRVAIPLAALALLIGGVAAVPSARSAVLRWLGIQGVRIERVPELPQPAPSALSLGERVPLPPGALVPAELGEPDSAYRDGEFLTLFYDEPRALFTQFRGSTSPDLIKKVDRPGHDGRARGGRRRAGLLARRRRPRPVLRRPRRERPRRPDAARRPDPASGSAATSRCASRPTYPKSRALEIARSVR